MSRYYLFVIALLLGPNLFAQQSAANSPIGYATVEEAFTALEKDPTATKTTYQGWAIFNQKNNGRYVIWSFTPEDLPTHPTVVRREIVKQGDELFINMDALCYSSKLDCDQLIEEFKQINAQIQQRQGGDASQ